MIAQLGMAIGQKLLTETDEALFYTLNERLTFKGAVKTTPQERKDI